MNDKTLISWIAYSHDFNKDRTFNFNGPNASIHRFNDEYSKHYWLMSWREGDIVNRQREDSLKKYIKTAGLGNLVELIFIEINNPIDIIEVREKLEKELIKLNISDCDIFISTGTPTMTVVWYFLKASQQYNLNLFQVSRPKKKVFQVHQIKNSLILKTLFYHTLCIKKWLDQTISETTIYLSQNNKTNLQAC